MAITHIATTTVSNSAGSAVDDQVATKPSGTTTNDVMIACVYKAANSVHTLTAPAGWTQVSAGEQDTTNINGSVWYKVDGGSEPANYTWVVNSTGVWGVSISTFRGVSTSSPVHASNGASYTTTDPAVAPTVNTSIETNIVTFRGSRDDSTTEVTHTATDTELADWGNDGGASTRNGAVYFSAPTAASSTAGGLSVNPSGSVTNGVMFTVALTPAGTQAPSGSVATASASNAPKGSIGAKAQPMP